MAGKTKTSVIEKEAKQLTETLLELLGVEAKVVASQEGEALKIDIEGDDLGLMIGYRGENLESLQVFLSVAINNKVGADSWTPVLVDVGGWRGQREEALKALVAREIEKISGEKTSVNLPPMPPSQRRVVHLLVAEHDGLKSTSRGEEPNRYVVIEKIG